MLFISLFCQKFILQKILDSTHHIPYSYDAKGLGVSEYLGGLQSKGGIQNH